MYATDPQTPAAVTVPGPTTDNPAAGTTGNPAPAGWRPQRLPAKDMPVPMAVAGWALGGLALVVALRYSLRNGGVA